MTKTDLKDFRARERELRGIEEQLDRLRARAEGDGAMTLTDMPKAASPQSDPMGDATAELVDLYSDYERKWDALIQMQQRVEGAIGALADPTQRALMRLRYLEGARWGDIGTRLGYSERQARRVHETAIARIKKNASPT